MDPYYCIVLLENIDKINRKYSSTLYVGIAQEKMVAHYGPYISIASDEVKSLIIDISLKVGRDAKMSLSETKMYTYLR